MPFGKTQSSHILSLINDIAIFFPVFLIIFTWRGFFQAAVAKAMGDTTAQEDGFLTLNPLAHIDLVGFSTIILVYFFIGGFLPGMLPRAVLLIILIMLGARWTIPIPIDDTKFKRHRLGGILTSLAGPIGNFILAFLFVPLLRLIISPKIPPYAMFTFVEMFKTLIDMSLFLGVLDLIPLPPFDGGRFLRYAMPYSKQHIVDWLEQHSLYIFIVLFCFPIISDIFFSGILGIAGVIKKMMFYLFF